MSGELGSLKSSYVDLVAISSAGTPPVNRVRMWVNSLDNNNLYTSDEIGNETIIVEEGSLAQGNAQYIWDWFENGQPSFIPNYSVVRLIQGGVDDGKLALSDNDSIAEDNFLGIVYGGSIPAGELGKVIYNGKVPGAVAGLGLPSNTTMYMSATPGLMTEIRPSFISGTIFELGITKGDDLYLRPAVRSELG